MVETHETQPQDRVARWVGIAVQVLAAGAALAAWVAIVGGGRVWASLHAAGISPGWIVPSFPERTLISEGLRALVVPLVLGAVVAGILLSRRTPRSARALPTEADFERWLYSGSAAALLAGRRPRALDELELRNAFEEIWRDKISHQVHEAAGARGLKRRLAQAADAYGDVALGVLLAVAATALAGAIWLLFHVHWWYIVWMLLVTTVFAATLYVIARRRPAPRVLAAAVFVAVALWAGVVSFLRLAGWKDPKFDLALVVRKSGVSGTPCVGGFFVMRSGGDVYIARHVSTSRRGRASSGFQIVLVPGEDVATLAVGPPRSTKKDWPVPAVELEPKGAQTCSTAWTGNRRQPP